MPKQKVPQNLQGVLWSVDVGQLDLEEHKSYIIHQVLMYGTFADIRWLFTVYPKEEVRDVFLNQPLKVYTKEAFNFIKNFVLGLKDEKISPANYVNVVYGRA